MSNRKVCPQCGEDYDATVGYCAKDGTPLVAASEANLIGKLVGGRYQILKLLGEGGMGQVYLGEHVRMKRKSAIKIMRPALVHEPEALQRFTREAENASKISHPNVAGIFDFGETDEGLVYLAMEYIDGESLSVTLKREVAMHPVVAADIIAQASDALQAAHDLGILHRDIKPDNVMVSRRSDGTFVVKIVDFGIARTMERGSQQVTRTGFAVGTPEFMSPEQLSGDVLDARSDQYSLALVAFMTLTGHDAFANSTSKESLIARLTSRPRRLDEVRSDLEWPESIQEVFDRALAPDPTDRFPMVAEFGNALAEAVSEMTPTQTAEMYRHAMGQRMAGAGITRTPVEGVGIRATPVGGHATHKTRPQPSPGKRRKDPASLGRRHSVFPYVVLLGAMTYGVWWYGSQQPSGTARRAADVIGSYATSFKAWAGGLLSKADSAVNDSGSGASRSATSAPAPAARRARRTDTTQAVEKAVTAQSTEAGPPPVASDTLVRRDTTVPPR